MTDEEKFKFWQEYKGGRVEASHNKDFESYRTIDLLSLRCYSNMSAHFISEENSRYLYARPIRKKTRLMTVEELDGKWIKLSGCSHLFKISSVDVKGGFVVNHNYYSSVEKLHKEDGRWNHKPSFKDLQSLEVDV